MAENWSEEELKSAVDAYLDILQREQRGERVVKAQVYRQLSAKHGRTEKSFEYRMQNISHVRALQGRQWLSGLPPARNVGTGVVASIERLMLQSEGFIALEKATFEAQVAEARRKVGNTPPAGDPSPKLTTQNSTAFQRSPEVAAWVLENSKGVCECCEKPAPFTRSDGTAFLEIHHVIRLADGGEDTVRNAVAVCPNCHREFHYGRHRADLAKNLRERISRLRT